MKKYAAKKNAFTLAETLLTLAIIGICATVAISTLSTINPTQKANVAMAKKAIVNFTNVSKQILMLHSKARTMDRVEFTNTSGNKTICENSQCFFNLMSKYLQITEVLTNDNKPTGLRGERCGKLSDGLNFCVTFDNSCTLNAKVETEGTSADNRIYILPPDEDNNTSALTSVEGACGFIYYDTNGKSKPNMGGKDQFALPIFKTGARIPTISD